MRPYRTNSGPACLYGIGRGDGYCEWCVECLMCDGISRDEAIRRVEGSVSQMTIAQVDLILTWAVAAAALAWLAVKMMGKDAP